MYFRSVAKVVKVLLDELRRLVARDAQLLAQRRLALAVDHREVGGLRAGPHVLGDARRGHLEDLHRGARVHVLAALEGVDEDGVPDRWASTRSSICE
jgi:hypothetical protein